MLLRTVGQSVRFDFQILKDLNNNKVYFPISLFYDSIRN
jgi:hypothetical protein